MPSRIFSNVLRRGASRRMLAAFMLAAAALFLNLAGVSIHGRPTAVHADPDCPQFATEADLAWTTVCRNTFIADPGRGNLIQRGQFLQPSLFNYFLSKTGPWGERFDANFLWYAPLVDDVFVPYQYHHAPDVMWFAACVNGGNPANGNLSLCPDTSTYPIGWPHINSDSPYPYLSCFYNPAGVHLHMVIWGSAYIATVCGNFRPGPGPVPVISGYKFEDLNGDGLWQKSSEPGVGGWTITLYAPDGTSTSTQTNADGSYRFEIRTPPGDYRIVEQPRPHWISTTADWITVNVPMGQGAVVRDNNNFGNYPAGKIVRAEADRSGWLTRQVRVFGYSFRQHRRRGTDSGRRPPHWNVHGHRDRPFSLDTLFHNLRRQQ